MNQHFAALVDGDVAGDTFGLGLGAMMRSVSLIACATYGPARRRVSLHVGFCRPFSNSFQGWVEGVSRA
ncbi:hypothetical protein AB6Q56_21350 [Dechloromonas sp. ARDL1]|uniref:hypothetical protein n=1 Tax=Dechloromonas sp. ARDL1 TaxID=3322121 RepID=UPI003DA71BF4